MHAAPDLDGFRDTWDVPGIIVEVSSRHGPEDIGAVMRQLGPAEDCTSEGRETHDGRRYRGEVERRTGCGGTATTVVSAALAPPYGRFLIRVFGQAVDARDRDAIDGALTSIEVGALDDAEAGRIVTDDAEARPVVTADAWLRRIATVRGDIDSVIAGTGSELTAAVLDDMAAAMRTCSRELVATAPASARLRPIRAQVDEACAEYDNGAECLTTAADIGTTVSAGSADDRRLTEALDCGLDALNRGGELLFRAEIDAESIQPR